MLIDNFASYYTIKQYGRIKTLGYALHYKFEGTVVRPLTLEALDIIEKMIYHLFVYVTLRYCHHNHVSAESKQQQIHQLQVLEQSRCCDIGNTLKESVWTS